MATTGITISFSKAPLANGDSYSFDESIEGSSPFRINPFLFLISHVGDAGKS